jgi:hypothetical protein
MITAQVFEFVGACSLECPEICGRRDRAEVPASERERSGRLRRRSGVA